MLKQIKEFGKCLEIVGFKNVEIGEVEGFLENINAKIPAEVTVQIFDAGLVATWQHLYFAVLNALTAFRNEENISRSLAVEIMLYASAQRQIRKAMELVGVKRNSTKIAVAILGNESEKVKVVLSTVATHLGGRRDDSVLDFSSEKVSLIRKVFRISGKQIEAIETGTDSEKALVDLIIEKMALLVTRR